MVEQFIICRNRFLTQEITGYHNLVYLGYNITGNPNFLNVLKNTFNTESTFNLNHARQEVENILLEAIPFIIDEHNLQNCICVCIPRAKMLNTYTPNQLFFRDAVKNAVRQIADVVDGTDVIIRCANTRTTHLGETICRVTATGRDINNDGERPYPGITSDTCNINAGIIRNQNIILIDDIYTKNVNIDEDCIQALLDNGARQVIFYAIAHTGEHE